MKSKKLLEILKAVEALSDVLVMGGGDSVISPLIKQLQAKPTFDLRVAIFLMDRSHGWPGSYDLNIRVLFERIADFQAVSGAKASAKGTRALASDLEAEGMHELSLASFAQGVSEFDLVRGFVKKLDACAGDREAFNKVMARLEAKGSVTKAQLSKIASAYVGEPKSYKTAALAINAIRQKFSSDQLFRSKTA